MPLLPEAEYLYAVIAAVGNIDITVFVDDDTVMIGKFIRHEYSSLVKHYPVSFTTWATN
jgi:hypothetical protein